MSNLLAHQIANRIGDLLATAVRDRDREDQGAIVSRRPLSCSKRSPSRRRQEIEATHGFDPNTVTVDRGVSSQSLEVSTADVRDPRLRSSQVVDRSHPKRHGRDSEIEAPSEHVVELLGAEIVGCSGMGEAVLGGVAAVAIKDNPDVARHRV